MLGRKRVTGRELARRLDVSQPWVSYRLTGHKEIGVNDLERIAQALEVEITELLPKPALRDQRDPGRINGRSGAMQGQPRSTRLLEGHKTSRTADPTTDNPPPQRTGIGPRSRPSWTREGAAA